VPETASCTGVFSVNQNWRELSTAAISAPSSARLKKFPFTRRPYVGISTFEYRRLFGLSSGGYSDPVASTELRQQLLQCEASYASMSR